MNPVNVTRDRRRRRVRWLERVAVRAGQVKTGPAHRSFTRETEIQVAVLIALRKAPVIPLGHGSMTFSVHVKQLLGPIRNVVALAAAFEDGRVS